MIIMSNKARVSEFLGKAGVYYLTTVDGNKPKCRPIGFQMLVDDEIYFCVGDFKEVYKQMQANPYVEICATIETDFIRYFGKAVFVESADLEAKACEVLPMLKQLYNEKTGFKMKIFKLEEAVAEFRSMMKVEERIEF